MHFFLTCVATLAQKNYIGYKKVYLVLDSCSIFYEQKSPRICYLFLLSCRIQQHNAKYISVSYEICIFSFLEIFHMKVLYESGRKYFLCSVGCDHSCFAESNSQISRFILCYKTAAPPVYDHLIDQKMEVLVWTQQLAFALYKSSLEAMMFC